MQNVSLTAEGGEKTLVGRSRLNQAGNSLLEESYEVSSVMPPLSFDETINSQTVRSSSGSGSNLYLSVKGSTINTLIIVINYTTMA